MVRQSKSSAQSRSQSRNANASQSNRASGRSNPSRSSSGKGKSKSSERSGSSRGQSKRSTRKSEEEAFRSDAFLDDRARKDIVGVAFALLAIVLLICAVMPVNGVVSSFISLSLHMVLGLGAYILPLFLLGFGISFFFRHDDGQFSGRIALGLFLIFIAFLGIIALFTPGSGQGKIAALFAEDNLVNLGGFVGSGLAWCGLTLLGLPITAVILIGIVLIGFAVIGFSVSRLMDSVKAKRSDYLRQKQETIEEQFEYAPYARVRMPDARLANDNPISSAETTSLPSDRISPVPLSDALTKKFGAKPYASDSDRFNKNLETVLGSSDDCPCEPDGGVHCEAEGSERDDAETQLLPPIGESATLAVADEAENASTERSPRHAASPKRNRQAIPLAQPQATQGFELPGYDFLQTSPPRRRGSSGEKELERTAANLQETLESFGVAAEVVGWVPGPTVTLFKVDLPTGVRVSRVTALNDDIALALAAPGVRIFAPIPGTSYVGIEVPNQARQTVLLGDVLKEAPAGPLQMAIGMDVEGNEIVSDLAKMPHLLIGGTTGSGKSVAINAMIMSIIMRATPDEVRLILIDPKRVEFSLYNDIPHLYVPVVTEPKEAASALSWGVAEMERRLKLFSKAGARNIGQYNAKVQSGALADENGENPSEVPYIVIVIDELADLMMNVGKEVEFSISRIAQLARAAGIHLIVATQRPSANVVTGLIKANITNRIAFNVASSIDSRVILDSPGAESLIGLGDLLLSKPELSKPLRIQGCYVSEDEISDVVEFLKEQGSPDYHSEVLTANLITLGASQPDGSGGHASSNDDPLVWDAAEMVVSSGLASTSTIQRRFKVGYSRAGRIMDLLEEKGIVGPPNGSKPREVLVDAVELETLKAFERND